MSAAAPDDEKTASGEKAKAAEEAPPAESGKATPEKTRVVAQWKHSSPFLSCRFDPTGRYLFAGAEDRSVVRWDVESGAATPFAGHESWVRAIAFHRESGTMLTGGFDGRLIWWQVDAAEPAPARVVDTGHGWVRAVAISPDGRLVATAGNDRAVALWSFENGERIDTLRGHECHVYNLAFRPSTGTDDGVTLASADLRGVVLHWKLGGADAPRRLEASALYKYDQGFRADIGGARCMSFSGDGKQLACGGITNVTNAFAGVGNPCVVLFDWESGEVAKTLLSKDKLRGVAWGVAFHADGFIVGASGGGGGGFLLFWKPDAEHEFFKLKLPNTARDLDLHPDGLRIATAHHDRHVRVSIMQA